MLSILHETPRWLAVNKSAGIAVERSPYGYPSVEDEVRDYISQHHRNPYVGIVHRLDRPVSGVLLLAKKPSALKALHEVFRERKVRKFYFALVEKEPPSPKGQLRHWLFKDLKNKRAVLYDQPAKNALECRLDYRVVEPVEGLWKVEVELFTGKYHQIRAQLAAIGCPVAGDEKYGATLPWQANAIALHAHKLIWNDPYSGAPITVEAPWDFPTI
mgnify:CR=1 FL=1